MFCFNGSINDSSTCFFLKLAVRKKISFCGEIYSKEKVLKMSKIVQKMSLGLFESWRKSMSEK